MKLGRRREVRPNSFFDLGLIADPKSTYYLGNADNYDDGGSSMHLPSIELSHLLSIYA